MKRDLKDQVNDIIRDEIQDVINQYVDNTGKGFDGEELKVNIPQDEVDKLLKEYKKIKKKQKSNFGQIKKLGLLDKNGRPLE
tara:strand:- start:1169 stop:1414 length:246 start_codon:yes stop_codon:yes gene_type:complete